MELPKGVKAKKELLQEILSSKNNTISDYLIFKKNKDTYITDLMKDLNKEEQKKMLKLAISNGHIDLFERLALAEKLKLNSENLQKIIDLKTYKNHPRLFSLWMRLFWKP